jgi:hypothetical protein
MVKAWSFVAALFLLLLTVCGCFSANFICNVSIGPTQGIVIHGVKDCAYPGLVTLPDGNLLTAYVCPGGVFITQLSTNEGATWGSDSIVGFNGLPSLALLQNGMLFLSTSVGDASGNGIPTYMIGSIGSGDIVTWSPPVSVSTPAWSYGCWGYSPVVQLINGNLLWPVWCYTDATQETGSSTVLLSTDGGVTWQKQVTVGNAITDGRDYDESAAVVYPNGNIVMIMRHTNPGLTDKYGSYWRSMSNDGGNTWSAPTEALNSKYVGRPTLALLPSGGLVLLSRAQVAGDSETGFGTSWDEGHTFSGFSSLGVGDPGTDNYDAMSLLPNGSIGVVTIHSITGGIIQNIDYRNLVDHCSSSMETSKQASCSRSSRLNSKEEEDSGAAPSAPAA